MKFTQTAALAAFIACASATDPAPAAVTCTISKLEAFSDKACTKAADAKVKDAVKAAEDGMKAAAKAIDGKCDKDTKSQSFCDGTGFGKKFFDDEKCAKAVAAPTDAQKAATSTWGACLKVSDTLYLKLTDATFVKATAAAVVAMVAS